MGVDTLHWASLERWSAMLFFVAGASFLLATVANGLLFFVGIAIPSDLMGVLQWIGALAAAVGLLGFYPRLATRIPRFARASLAVAVGAAIGLAVGLLVFVSAALLSTAGSAAAEAAFSVAIALFLLSGIVMAVAFLLVGSAILRTDAFPSSVGLLLWAFVAALVVIAIAPELYGGATPEWLSVSVSGVTGGLMLAVGLLLRIEFSPP